MQTVSDVDGGAIDFEDLYLAERVRLVRAMLLLTGRVGEAEDLAQDAFVRVYERWPQIREMDSPTGYLYRTALNLHRKRLRVSPLRFGTVRSGRKTIPAGTSPTNVSIS